MKTRTGYEITMTVSDDGEWPKIAAKNLRQHLDIGLPQGLSIKSFKAAEPRLKTETVFADWKDIEGLVDGFRDGLRMEGRQIWLRNPES